ncbi:MAG TPA: hypothetical protein VJ714_06180 [Anaerolineae bacterium]|nr:hypothetical protein [Anaerolineae bacterium]
MVTEGGPSASDVVYLFGDRFVGETRPGGEQLVYGGNKVDVGELSEQLLLAAFADLASKGYLGLEVVEHKKLGLFTSKDVLVTPLGSPQETLYGLDAAVWDSLRGDPKKDRVRSLIARIIGGKRFNPWSDLVALAKSGLAEQGYLNVDKEELRFRPDKVHWSANEELISPHQGRVDQVKAQLSSLESRDPALYEQLAKSVKEGIRAMREKPRTRRYSRRHR